MTRGATQTVAAYAFIAALPMLIASALRPSLSVQASDVVTWRQQVAPIVFKNCTSCHHAGGSGPFSLTSYQEAKRWSSVMQTVTASRYMPPWLPAPGHDEFVGDRRMSEADIATIRRWVQQGMKEGDGADPAPPTYSSDWELGPPDLILEMTSPLQVPASGQDLFMNFALPTEITSTRWIRAMQIKPGSPRLVHHANVIIDRTASLRRAHPESWRSGVPGMDILVDSGESFDPDSHFLFWKPDSTALVEPASMPWRLDPGNDLVLNMHLKPTGKVEQVQARIGLYFSDKPATEHPMLLQLEHDDKLDIPAGDKSFVIQDSLTLPVAVDVLGVYPHAHYLGKELEGWATLPNGESRSLVLIRDWDINRQSVYRLSKPLRLPRGTVLHMRYTYDNSSANLRNPNSPPIRVRAGNRSVDEMGHLWLQVLPRPEPGTTSDGRTQLEKAWMQNRLTKDPNDTVALYNLGSLAMMSGDGKQAASLYQRVLAIHPGDVRTMTSIASASAIEGDWRAAQKQYRAAVEKDASYTDAAFDLAQIDLRHDDLPEAESLLRALSRAHPDDAAIHAELGTTLATRKSPDEAKQQFQEALGLDARNVEALSGLGKLDLDAQDPRGAQPFLLRALAEKPDAECEHLLALSYAESDDIVQALIHLKLWQQLAPADAGPHRALAQVYSLQKRFSEALTEQRMVISLDPENASDWNDLGALEARGGDFTAARREFERALQLDPNNETAEANLARIKPH
jgi:Flp pilus assembly protein TadD/mono/diheme cytochrome c family protein